MSTHRIENNRNKLARENHLNFLYSLYQNGVELGYDDLSALKEHGYISSEDFFKKHPTINGEVIENDTFTKTSEERNIDANLDFVKGSKEENELFLTSSELEERRKSRGYVFIGLGRPITKEDWLPKSITEHEPEFVEFINSINLLGFSNRKQYKKLTLYCQQAYEWLAEEKTLADFDYIEDKENYMMEELRRCSENCLYFVNKYGWYKDGNVDGGEARYVASPAHEVIIYLDDCGYSFGAAKGRQMAFTTTKQLCNLRSVLFRKNFFIKFVTEDKEKAMEIFEDKLKFPFSKLPEWMQPNVLNDRENLLKFGSKESKGDRDGVNSSIRVSAPKPTVIAGGAPNKADIDEAGNIGILTKMIEDQRPTMYAFDPVSKKIKIKRQLSFYGCVCAGTKVFTNSGKVINIEDLKEEDGVIGYNGRGYDKGIINWIKPPENKQCYRIETSGGNFIECSYDHPILSSNIRKRVYRDGEDNIKQVSFKKTEDLRIGDNIVMLDEIPVFGKKNVKDARLFGLLVGDGNYTGTIQLSVADKEISDFIKSKYNTSIHKSIILKNGSVFENIGIKGLSKKLRANGMFGQSKERKRLPIDINDYNEKSVREFVAGYFDADGNVHYNKSKGTRIVLTSVVKELLFEMKYQLMKLGIGCHITKEFRSKNEKKLSSGQKDYTYKLYINRRKDVLIFRKKIKLLCGHKNKVLKNSINLNFGKNVRNNDKADYLINKNYPEKGEYFNGMKNMSKLRFDRITKIIDIGVKPIYNLNVSKTHTYIANGFITANTGGEMEGGGKAFETQFMSVWKDWQNGIFTHYVVPIFFDWTARPGITKEDYEREKHNAYAKANTNEPDAKDSIVKFHQSFPSTLEDVFKTTGKTMVDEEFLNRQQQRIREALVKTNFQLVKRGYFEPVYDLASPADEHSDVPYKIIGANFVPTDDIDPRGVVTMFMEPDRKYINRYFQGTDPIMSDSGLSDMASAIWDKWYKTISCVVNFRTTDPNEPYLQTMLMGIYYNTNPEWKKTKELLESNIGPTYTQYIKMKGYDDSMVLNYELPPFLQNHSTKNEGVGIDNKSPRTGIIISKLTELINGYGEKIFIERFFLQLKSFVCTVIAGGTETWGPSNKKYFRDDVLFACVYAYICAEYCYPELIPVNAVKEKSKLHTVVETYYDKDWNLRKRVVRK